MPGLGVRVLCGCASCRLPIMFPTTWLRRGPCEGAAPIQYLRPRRPTRSLAATLSHIASRDMLSPQNGALKTV